MAKRRPQSLKGQGTNLLFEELAMNGSRVDILISDLQGQAARTLSAQVIGWWCLFDNVEAWEWGVAFLTDIYQQPSALPFDPSKTSLQLAAND
jgi:hypothetical protein